jgi:stress-induced morphogen
MPIEANILQTTLEQAFPGSIVKIIDLMGDQDHYSVEITSNLFKGKNRVEQHKMVNEALKFCVGTTLHALQIKTTTPKETV